MASSTSRGGSPRPASCTCVQRDGDVIAIEPASGFQSSRDLRRRRSAWIAYPGRGYISVNTGQRTVPAKLPACIGCGACGCPERLHYLHFRNERFAPVAKSKPSKRVVNMLNQMRASAPARTSEALICPSRSLDVIANLNRQPEGGRRSAEWPWSPAFQHAPALSDGSLVSARGRCDLRRIWASSGLKRGACSTVTRPDRCAVTISATIYQWRNGCFCVDPSAHRGLFSAQSKLVAIRFPWSPACLPSLASH